MSWGKVIRFLADLHFAIGQGLDLAANLLQPDGPERTPDE